MLLFRDNTKDKRWMQDYPMMKDVRRALEDEKIRQQELGVRCTTVIDGYTDFRLFNRFGQPHNPAAINREIDRLVLAYNAQEMEKAAEENRTPLSCRISVATSCGTLFVPAIARLNQILK